MMASAKRIWIALALIVSGLAYADQFGEHTGLLLGGLAIATVTLVLMVIGTIPGRKYLLLSVGSVALIQVWKIIHFKSGIDSLPSTIIFFVVVVSVIISLGVAYFGGAAEERETTFNSQ